MVGSPHTECDKSGPVNPDGLLQMLWQKCATSAECKTIRIAMSAVMDGWDGMILSSEGFWFIKVFSKRFWERKPVGLVGVYLAGTEER